MLSTLRRATFVVVAAALVVGMPTVASAAADNEVVAINQQDDSFVARHGMKVTRVPGDTVDEQNIAFAYASCARCQTVAVAVQVLLAPDRPSVVVPVNQAWAVNHLCTSCRTLASAYQFVLTTDGHVRFSEAGNEELSRIRDELAVVVRSQDPIESIQAQVDALMDDLELLLETELVRAGKPGDVLEYERTITG